jgi:hypothetical protein
LGLLVKAWKPEFERCLVEVFALLPKLADKTFQTFIDKVHSATTRLSTAPTSVEDFASYLEFMQEVDKEKPALDMDYDKVVAIYDLMQEVEIQVPAIQMAAYGQLEADYAALRDALWQAEGGRDSLVQLFKSDLEEQVESLSAEVASIRVLAHHDMILDVNSSVARVLEYTDGLLHKVEGAVETAAKINKYQKLFKVEESHFLDLEDCSEDVQVRL